MSCERASPVGLVRERSEGREMYKPQLRESNDGLFFSSVAGDRLGHSV